MKQYSLWLIVSTLLISACAKPAKSPASVAHQYWQLIQDGKTKAAEQLVSSNSRQAFEDTIKTLKPVRHFELKNSRTSVTTILNPSTTNPALNQPFNTSLILEQGRWRIDATQTQIPLERAATKQQQPGDNFSKSMRNNMHAMSNNMHEGIKLLNNALRNGSKDMHNSFLKGMKKLNESMQKSIAALKRHKQQDQQPSVPAQPNANKGEGII